MVSEDNRSSSFKSTSLPSSVSKCAGILVGGLVVGEDTRFGKPDQVTRLPFPLLLRVATSAFADAWSTTRIASSNATDIVVARVDVRGVMATGDE